MSAFQKVCFLTNFPFFEGLEFSVQLEDFVNCLYEK